MLHDYIPKSTKSEPIRKLINEALDILRGVNIPFDRKTPKGLQSMAVAFLAIADVRNSWREAKGQSDNRHLTTRQIITYVNEHFEENISSGSYDTVRDEHLAHLRLADLVLNSAQNPTAAPNDPRRGYTLDNDFKELILTYNTPEWPNNLRLFNKNRPSLEEILKRKRNVTKIPVVLPNGVKIFLSPGGHNRLQREIIEEFLPIYGNGCEVLYIGDTAKKYLVREAEKLKELGFFELSHDSLPDIVAYDKKRNWLFLIEAFYSSGPMSEERVLELKKSLKDCSSGLIFVTAFISKLTFKKNAGDIAWETEVWTADNPEHLIHFNGGRFLGPYPSVD